MFYKQPTTVYLDANITKTNKPDELKQQNFKQSHKKGFNDTKSFFTVIFWTCLKVKVNVVLDRKKICHL